MRTRVRLAVRDLRSSDSFIVEKSVIGFITQRFTSTPSPL